MHTLHTHPQVMDQTKDLLSLACLQSPFTALRASAGQMLLAGLLSSQSATCCDSSPLVAALDFWTGNYEL